MSSERDISSTQSTKTDGTLEVTTSYGTEDQFSQAASTDAWSDASGTETLAADDSAQKGGSLKLG